MNENLIEIQNLKKYFPLKRGVFSKGQYVHAVDNVNLRIPPKKIFSVVGESGSGKTTFGRTILRLIEPTSGKIMYKGQDIMNLSQKEMITFRKKMQIVFQDPYNSLHPRRLVKDIIGEGLYIHEKISSNEILDRVKEILKKVGLNEDHMFRYPHEFSGGQRQRIAMARALILNPEFIVLDEPTSALDVSVQATILDLLIELKNTFSLTYLFITHNLAVVDYISDFVAVMYLGQIVEIGSKDDIFTFPSHPYTYALLNAIPDPDPKRKRSRIIPQGEIPSAVNPPKGCRFHTRCPYAKEICKKLDPESIEISKGHLVKCHFPMK